MLRQWDRSGSTYAGTPLLGGRILYAVYGDFATKPKITIQRNPQARLKIVAEVRLKCGNGSFRLGSNARKEWITREILRISGEKPSGRIAVQNEVIPALRIAKFRFEGPAII